MKIKKLKAGVSRCVDGVRPLIHSRMCVRYIDDIQRLLAEGKSRREVAKHLGLVYSTLCRFLRKKDRSWA